jgi:hypothetical protein
VIPSPSPVIPSPSPVIPSPSVVPSAVAVPPARHSVSRERQASLKAAEQAVRRHLKESRAAQDRLLKQVHALTQLKAGVSWAEDVPADGGGSGLDTRVDGGAAHRLTLTRTAPTWTRTLALAVSPTLTHPNPLRP